MHNAFLSTSVPHRAAERNGSRNSSFLDVDKDSFVPELPQKASFFASTLRVPDFSPVERKLRRQDQIPFRSHPSGGECLALSISLPFPQGGH
jgi:hypothetical protein